MIVARCKWQLHFILQRVKEVQCTLWPCVTVTQDSAHLCPVKTTCLPGKPWISHWNGCLWTPGTVTTLHQRVPIQNFNLQVLRLRKEVPKMGTLLRSHHFTQLKLLPTTGHTFSWKQLHSFGVKEEFSMSQSASRREFIKAASDDWLAREYLWFQSVWKAFNDQIGKEVLSRIKPMPPQSCISQVTPVKLKDSARAALGSVVWKTLRIASLQPKKHVSFQRIFLLSRNRNVAFHCRQV